VGYQVGERRSAFLEGTDYEHYTLSASAELAGFVLRGTVYETSERGVFDRGITGMSWSISRGFHGTLPIITAPQRRGTIR
jgi:hypothetical protein